MSFFCPESSTLSCLRAKSKVLAGSLKTETVSCPRPISVTLLLPFSPSSLSSLPVLPQRSRHRACALVFLSFILENSCPRQLHSLPPPFLQGFTQTPPPQRGLPWPLYSHNPSPAATTSLLSPAWPSPFSVQFSRSVVSNSFQHHGMQHIRLPCPSSTPGACSNSCPSTW